MEAMVSYRDADVLQTLIGTDTDGRASTLQQLTWLPYTACY